MNQLAHAIVYDDGAACAWCGRPGSWARPLFDGEHPKCTGERARVGTVGDGVRSYQEIGDKFGKSAAWAERFVRHVLARLEAQGIGAEELRAWFKYGE